MRWRDYLFSAVYALYLLILISTGSALLCLSYGLLAHEKIIVLTSAYQTGCCILGLVFIGAALLLAKGMILAQKQEILKIDFQTDATAFVVAFLIQDYLEKKFLLKKWSVEVFCLPKNQLEIVIYDSYKRAHLLFCHQQVLKEDVKNLLRTFLKYSGGITLTVIKR